MERLSATDLADPNATGGDCTDCHRGENVFLVPDIGSTLGLVPDRMPSDWHDPIVDASWLQNPGPFAYQLSDEDIAADACFGCHNAGAAPAVFGGRFPVLTAPNDDFCAIAKAAFSATMPPFGVPVACLADQDCDLDDGVDGDERCQNNLCFQECTVDTDCQAGQACQGNACIQACSTTGTCVEGDACSSNADCMGALVCGSNKCSVACVDDGGCPAGQACRDLTCVPASLATAIFDQCP